MEQDQQFGLSNWKMTAIVQREIYVFHDVRRQTKGQLEVKSLCHPLQRAHILLMWTLDFVDLTIRNIYIYIFIYLFISKKTEREGEIEINVQKKKISNTKRKQI